MSNLLERKDLEQWSDSRYTSQSIAYAIFKYAEFDPAIAQRVWESPTAEEFRIIEREAFSNEIPECTSLFWGNEILKRPVIK